MSVATLRHVAFAFLSADRWVSTGRAERRTAPSKNVPHAVRSRSPLNNAPTILSRRWLSACKFASCRRRATWRR